MTMEGIINAKIPREIRLAIETHAKHERISLGAATRHFLSIGIENHKAAIA